MIDGTGTRRAERSWLLDAVITALAALTFVIVLAWIFYPP